MWKLLLAHVSRINNIGLMKSKLITVIFIVVSIDFHQPAKEEKISYFHIINV